MKNNIYNSKDEDAVAVKVIVFDDMPDYILSVQEYVSAGKFKGVIKNHGIPLRNVVEVNNGKMSHNDFYSLEPWEG